MTVKIENLEYWTQRVLPQVYDDSLSFQELLYKVVAKLNEVIGETNAYFDKDLKVYVGEILQGWYDDGTLASIINQDVFTDINSRLDSLYEGMESVSNHGIISDGVTDQTTALVTLFTTGALANYDGMIFIPYGTRFTIETVYDAIPLDAVVRDESMLNYSNSTGYKTKVVSIGSQDKQANDTSFQVMSAHHPTLILNNLGTAEDEAGVLSESASTKNTSILYAFGMDASKNILASFRAHSYVVGGMFNYRISNERKYSDPSTVNGRTLLVLDEEGKSGFNANPQTGITHVTRQHGTSTATTQLLENTLSSSKARVLLKAKDVSGVVVQRYIDLESNGDLTIRGTDASEHMRILADGTVSMGKGFTPPKYTTANRPTTLPQGSMIYDTTLFKPIWYYGNGAWRDAMGTTV